MQPPIFKARVKTSQFWQCLRSSCRVMHVLKRAIAQVAFMLNSVWLLQTCGNYYACWQDANNSSVKQQAFQRHLMYYSHPNIPWLQSFPNKSGYLFSFLLSVVGTVLWHSFLKNLNCCFCILILWIWNLLLFYYVYGWVFSKETLLVFLIKYFSTMVDVVNLLINFLQSLTQVIPEFDFPVKHHTEIPVLTVQLHISYFWLDWCFYDRQYTFKLSEASFLLAVIIQVKHWFD
jgi:hypothetical protein